MEFIPGKLYKLSGHEVLYYFDSKKVRLNEEGDSYLDFKITENFLGSWFIFLREDVLEREDAKYKDILVFLAPNGRVVFEYLVHGEGFTSKEEIDSDGKL